MLGDTQEPLDPAAGPEYQLLDAMLGVTTGLSLPKILQHLIQVACALVDARYGALGVLGDGNVLSEFITTGAPPGLDEEIGHLPQGLGILGLLIEDPQPIRLRDLNQHPLAHGFPPNHPPMRSFLGVPIRIGESVFGNLYLCEKRNAEEFTERDEGLAVSLAAFAAVTIENAQLYQRLQDLALIEERERIARDLHDKVIQRLFATGMSLQAMSRSLDDVAAPKVEQAVEELDAVIAEIRTSIFDLEVRPAALPNLSAAILNLVDETLRYSGVEPNVTIEGPLSERVDPELGQDLLATTRELLTNVIRHAHATRVEVRVEVGADLVLEIRDDGRGFARTSTRPGGRGLLNAKARANAWGGDTAVADHGTGGTSARWRVPLPSRDP